MSFIIHLAFFVHSALATPSAVHTSVSLNYLHACATTAQGDVVCWGMNEYGQGHRYFLGTACESHWLGTPQRVEGLTGHAVQVVAGSGHTCALNQEGQVSCWGSNLFGQLGLPTSQSSCQPVAITLPEPVHQLFAGNMETLALTQSGNLYRWGSNQGVQLMAKGVQTAAAGGARCYITWTHQAFCEVDGQGKQALPLTDVRSLSVSDDAHLMYLLKDGTFGRFSYEEGDHTWKLREVTGVEPGAVAITRGRFNSCLIMAAGNAECWGGNYNCELGNGYCGAGSAYADRNRQTFVGHITALVAGRANICALNDQGQVACTGSNSHGQRGDGSPRNQARATATVIRY